MRRCETRIYHPIIFRANIESQKMHVVRQRIRLGFCTPGLIVLKSHGENLREKIWSARARSRIETQLTQFAWADIHYRSRCARCNADVRAFMYGAFRTKREPRLASRIKNARTTGKIWLIAGMDIASTLTWRGGALHVAIIIISLDRPDGRSISRGL